MTRKDYVKFAAMLKAHSSTVADFKKADKDLINNTLKYVAEDCADIFAADNPNFDRARFLAACGVE